MQRSSLPSTYLRTRTTNRQYNLPICYKPIYQAHTHALSLSTLFREKLSLLLVGVMELEHPEAAVQIAVAEAEDSIRAAQHNPTETTITRSILLLNKAENLLEEAQTRRAQVEIELEAHSDTTLPTYIRSYISCSRGCYVPIFESDSVTRCWSQT